MDEEAGKPAGLRGLAAVMAPLLGGAAVLFGMIHALGVVLVIAPGPMQVPREMWTPSLMFRLAVFAGLGLSFLVGGGLVAARVRAGGWPVVVAGAIESLMFTLGALRDRDGFGVALAATLIALTIGTAWVWRRSEGG